ncbi:MAG: TolC family protein [Planctomycetes bacterium]|nr:TolC family protein [Planctomycetota bacterium]
MLPLLCACVAYERDQADARSIAAEVALRRGGAFTFAEAAEHMLANHPELRAVEARARAAGAAITAPLPVIGEWRGRNEAVGVMVDPIALLGLGPRGAAIDTAEARAQEAAEALAVARWRALGELAEVYLLDQAIAELEVVLPELEVDAFERSGLASPITAAQLRASQARAASERLAHERVRRDQLARLRHLLGLDDRATLTLRPGWTFADLRPDEDALLDRPDLALAAARFETADRAFRQAVAEQYPSLQIGPSVSLRGDPMRLMSMLTVPLGMAGLAEAARERREAARHDLEDTLLEAHREATQARNALAAARAEAAAADAMWQASARALTAARANLEVQPDAFAPFAAAARELMDATTMRRNATVARAIAEVRLAVAYGWPRNQAPSPTPNAEEQR